MANNATCLCSYRERLQDIIEPCLVDRCDTIDLLQAQNISLTTCGVKSTDEGPSILISSWTLFGLAFICGLLRVVGRVSSRFATGHLGLDDLTMGLALVIMLFLQIVITLSTTKTLGKDIWTIPPEAITQGWKVSPSELCGSHNISSQPR
jgi:hypothetical protein